MPLESLVEAPQLEVVDRVGPVSVVAPKLDDRDPTLPRESVHVARWDLPTPGQLLGSQSLWSRDGVHNVLYESLLRLVARNPQGIQTEPTREGSSLPAGSPRGGNWDSGSGIRLKSSGYQLV
jgi:hypothetical protein